MPLSCLGCGATFTLHSEVNEHVCPFPELQGFMRFADPESRGTGAECSKCGYVVTAHHPGMSSTPAEMDDVHRLFTRHHGCVSAREVAKG